MTRQLEVWLLGIRAGTYVQDEHGSHSFSYAAEYLTNAKALPLSNSLPLRHEPFSGRVCRAFFSGILPEEEKRDIIARRLGISARNEFALLERIGGECAGAITFVPPGQSLKDPNEREYMALRAEDLDEILDLLPHRPLMTGEDGIRLSLAGAGDKLAVAQIGTEMFIPLGASPSTHIMKPNLTRFPGIVRNEALCMTLAGAIGLPVAPVQMHQSTRHEYLLVSRFDRLADREGKPSDPGYTRILRLHQEDFCQALGIAPERKYQVEGGPSLRMCFQLIRDISVMPSADLLALLDAVLFNLIIGNHDAHGKNFSIVYSRIDTGIEARLAPFYDLVCTVAYPELSPSMAMRIGDVYRSADVWSQHLKAMAEEIGFSGTLTLRRFQKVAAAILEWLSASHPAIDAAPEVAALIRSRAGLFLDRFAG